MLEHISHSKYKNHFILKGGFLIASLVGIDFRTTMDMDFTIKSYPLNHDSLEAIFKELCENTINDEITFEYLYTNEIREDDEYEGFRVHLKAHFYQLSVDLKMDITTGDKITPAEIQYNYPKLLDASSIEIYAYNIETILAEKLETVLSRSTANTRLRDFYDIYSLYKLYESKVNIKILKSALHNTCTKRNSSSIISDYSKICNTLMSSKEMTELWSSYQKTYNYAKDILWSDVVSQVLTIMDKLSNN